MTTPEYPVVIVDDLLMVQLPEPKDAHHWTLGEHRMVQVLYNDDQKQPWWQCLEHGPECWMTVAARMASGQPILIPDNSSEGNDNRIE